MKRIVFTFKKYVFLTALVLGIVSLYSCNQQSSTDEHNDTDKDTVEVEVKHETHEHKWTYEGEKGPENWAGLSEEYSPCGGKLQSPIDISNSYDEPSLRALNIEYQAITELELVNNGHSVQANIPNGCFLNIDGKKFNLLQFHFHCPSEHTINGEAAASEIHLVHAIDNKIAVIGLLLNEGNENPALAKFIDQIPAHDGDKANVEGMEFNPAELLPQDKGYFTYPGSLTTPPCTESVHWFVMKQILEASTEQINTLKNAMPPNNARPVQAINGRLITDF